MMAIIADDSHAHGGIVVNVVTIWNCFGGQSECDNFKMAL